MKQTPIETEEEFEETLAYARGLGYARNRLSKCGTSLNPTGKDYGIISGITLLRDVKEIHQARLRVWAEARKFPSPQELDRISRL